MLVILNAICKLRIWADTRGQDLTEYALLGGFMAAACGAVVPDITISVTTVFSKVVAMLTYNGSNTFPGG